MVTTIARILLGGVFLSAGLSKLVNASEFMSIIDGYKLIPSVLSPLAASLLILVELVCGGCLIVGYFKRQAILLASALLLLFTAVAIITMARGLEVECGCLIGLEQRQVGPLLIVQDIVLP